MFYIIIQENFQNETRPKYSYWKDPQWVSSLVLVDSLWELQYSWSNTSSENTKIGHCVPTSKQWLLWPVDSSKMSVHLTTKENILHSSFILLASPLGAPWRSALFVIGQKNLRNSTAKWLVLLWILTSVIWPGKSLGPFGTWTFELSSDRDWAALAIDFLKYWPLAPHGRSAKVFWLPLVVLLLPGSLGWDCMYPGDFNCP